MAFMGDIQIRGDGTDPKQIMNYLYQLEEQIRYALANIGADNIQEGAITPQMLSPAIKQNIQEITISQEKQERTSKQLKSEDGKLRTLIVETERGIMRQMQDVEEGLEATITETAGRLESWVKDYAYEIQSGIAIEAAGVTISGGKYVKIESTGKFIVDSTNLKVDAQGNVEMTGTVNAESGEIGGFELSPLGMGTVGGGGVWVSSGGGSSASAAVTVYGPNGAGDVAFQALSQTGTVYIKSLWMHDGTNWRDVTSAILALL